MKVYIAGPYTKGDTAINVREAILAGDQIYSMGFIPFIPHLTHFWHIVCPRPYEQWLKLDIEWLLVCDAVLRLPGDSSGADAEVLLATNSGIPVYFGMEEFIKAHR